MKICYQPKTFDADRRSLIDLCESICEDYARQGYDLTLRQLYYQLVARGRIANKQEEYKRLGDIVADARMAGLIDWDHIVDRTRNLRALNHWERPSELIDAAAKQYATDKWATQDNYVEVWVEKDALVGVVERAANDLDVPFFACRGYTSLSEMWSAGQRLSQKIADGKSVHIIHLGDHDPSGIDMSRDIHDRLNLFVDAHTGGGRVHVLRAALNMAQIERLNPPPNPAKVSDSRAAKYIEEYGESSWELDALDPAELNEIITRAVTQYRDEEKWKAAEKIERRGRKTLETIHAEFPSVVAFLRGELAT